MMNFVHPPFLFALPGIRFTLCPGWEVTAYKYDGECGRFGFSSPDGSVCQYSSRKVPATPDLVRIWEEIHRRAMGTDDVKLRFEKWNSGLLFARSAPGERFYASRFDPERMILHEWIFPEMTTSAEETARSLLKSVAENCPDSNGYTLYALWGLEARIPSGFELEEINPYPANIELVFENKMHHKIVVRRIGFASFHLQDDTLTRFYQELLVQKKYVVKKTGTRACCNRNIPSHEFRIRGRFGLDALLGPWWKGIGEAFLAEEENRIYTLEHIAPARISARESLENIFVEKLKS